MQYQSNCCHSPPHSHSGSPTSAALGPRTKARSRAPEVQGSENTKGKLFAERGQPKPSAMLLELMRLQCFLSTSSAMPQYHCSSHDVLHTISYVAGTFRTSASLRPSRAGGIFSVRHLLVSRQPCPRAHLPADAEATRSQLRVYRILQNYTLTRVAFIPFSPSCARPEIS
eukprot:SAG11_NODE_174_length_13505_cov_9.126585_1_plen_170_part_00